MSLANQSGASIHREEPATRIDAHLRTRFKGEFIYPDHPNYDSARSVWNGMVDKHPALIMRCTCTEDVVAAVNFARNNSLLPAIRCGGHSVSGKAISDGGLTIDLSKTEVLGKPVKYGGDDLDAFEAYFRAFAPGWLARDMRLMAGRLQRDGMAASNAGVEKMSSLLGRPLRTYRDFALEVAKGWGK